MRKPIYNSKQWILGSCVNCNSLTYVEPHGTTAHCKKCNAETEHLNIPYRNRDTSGFTMTVPLAKDTK